METKALIAASALLCTALAAHAEQYPNGNITTLVPYPAGGGTDTGARIAAPSLEKALGQKIIIKNVAGAGGTVGATELAESKGDGYTIGFMPIGPMATQPHIRKVKYTTDSFQPICRMVDDPLAVLVGPDAYKDFASFREAATGSRPLLSAGPAPGSMPHIAQVALAEKLGTKFTYVPHKSGALTSKSLLSGKVNLATEMASFGGRFGLQTLAVLGEKRHPAFPDIPSLTELGGPTLNYSIWMGLFASASTPPAIVEKLSAACETATRDPDYIQRAKDGKRFVSFLNHTEFTSFYKAHFVELGEVMAKAGLVKK